MPVTASQLKTRLAELLEVSKKEADNILAAFEQVMTEVVENADSVMIPGVGKLVCLVAPSRKARNPATGESIMTKPGVKLKFKISSTLKKSAPSLKSKMGKRLLADAEEKQAEREKAKRKRERLAAKNGDSGTKKSKSKSKKLKTSSKSGTKKSKAKSGRRF